MFLVNLFGHSSPRIHSDWHMPSHSSPGSQLWYWWDYWILDILHSRKAQHEISSLLFVDLKHSFTAEKCLSMHCNAMQWECTLKSRKQGWVRATNKHFKHPSVCTFMAVEWIAAFVLFAFLMGNGDASLHPRTVYWTDPGIRCSSFIILLFFAVWG